MTGRIYLLNPPSGFCAGAYHEFGTLEGGDIVGKDGTRYIPAPPEGAPEYWELAREVVEQADLIRTILEDWGPRLPHHIRTLALADRLRPHMPKEG